MAKAVFLSLAVGLWAASDPQSLRDCGLFVVDAVCNAGHNIWVVATTQVMNWFA